MEKRSTTLGKNGGAAKLDFFRQRTITQSIEIDNLFVEDLTTSGSFNFNEIKNVSFGKLLEAIPLPALLVDASLHIVFCEHSFFQIGGRLGIDHRISLFLPIPRA